MVPFDRPQDFLLVLYLNYVQRDVITYFPKFKEVMGLWTHSFRR